MGLEEVGGGDGRVSTPGVEQEEGGTIVGLAPEHHCTLCPECSPSGPDTLLSPLDLLNLVVAAPRSGWPTKYSCNMGLGLGLAGLLG